MKISKSYILLDRFSIFLLCFSFIFFAYSVSVNAEKKTQAKVLDLKTSISIALANSHSILAKKEAIKEAKYGKKKARTDFLPGLSTTYGYKRFDRAAIIENVSFDIPTSVGPQTFTMDEFQFGSKDNYEWKVTATQPVFTGFAISSAYKLAKQGIDVSRLNFEIEKLDVALKVKQIYYKVLSSDKYLDVAQKAVAQLLSQANDARAFYEAGIIPINDLLKVEVQLANTQHGLVQAKTGTKIARTYFNTILTRPVTEPVLIADVLVKEPKTDNFEKCFKIALKNSPELKTLNINIKQTEQQVRLAKSEYYPHVYFSVDYVKAGDKPGVSGSDYHMESSWQAQAAVKWNFWQWGKTHYAVSGAKSKQKQLIRLKSGLIDKIRLDVKEAVLNELSAKTNIPSTTKAVEQAEENLRVGQERFRSQLTTTSEVLDAQTLLTQARLNYYNSMYDYKLAEAKLQRAMGKY